MVIEWLGGPLDGTMFEAPDGSETINVVFPLPYSIRSAMEEGIVYTKELDIPVEYRNEKYYVRYPTNEERGEE